MQHQPLLLQILRRRQMQFQRGRLQRGQHLLDNERIQSATREALTLRFAIAGQGAMAVVTQAVMRVVVIDDHAVAAAAALEQPAQQSRTLRGAPTLAARARFCSNRS